MKKLTFLILLLTAVSNYAQKESIEAPLLHSVYFWLENPNSTTDQAAFEAAIQKLIITNPQGLRSYLGKPARTELREVVDNSYTYAYIMTFESREAEAAYQTDPTHLRFIDEAQHLWKKVVVYDAVPIMD
ncbi:MAG: Uncharacterised protein [Flavobacteriaceae bacterium]|nr:MAG: Uncharacterised protein [Flavobacteriaceae bacterium]|tara:strand:- start:7624 stop:8013 length:390 start_codon:yes stop_codon:yes gene_type:complete